MKEKESMISKQERAAKQQELLEKKRRAKAEYNTSDTMRTDKSSSDRVSGKLQSNRQNKLKLEKQQEQKPRKIKSTKENQEKRSDVAVSVSQWFVSICWLKIPMIGFFYALFLALRDNIPEEKRNFARGYLLYRTLVLVLSVSILYVLYRAGLSFIDELLSFVK